LREENRLRVLQNEVLRKVFGHKREVATGGGKDCIKWSFMNCKSHQILFGLSNEEELDGRGKYHV
jgi:hypothetical protein